MCAAPVRRALEVLHDPHLAARGFFQELPTGDEQRPYLYPGLIFRMGRTPNALRTGPVRLGEHNREIYCDLLGYSPADLAVLEQQGHVGTAHPPHVWRPESEA